MEADSHYIIGRKHDVCQDYSVVGKSLGNNPFCIVADGCSTAPNSDIGARLLAHSLVQQGEEGVPFNFSEAIYKACHTADSLGLPRECTMASVMALQVTNNNVIAYMVGDGFLMARERLTGNIIVWQLRASNNAPEYLYYITNPKDHAVYQQYYTGKKEINVILIEKNGKIREQPDEKQFRRELIIRLKLDLESYDIIAVSSDGINSFDNTVLTTDIIRDLVNVKNTKGSFVTRRMKRFERECIENEEYHSDDISIAAVYLGD